MSSVRERKTGSIIEFNPELTHGFVTISSIAGKKARFRLQEYNSPGWPEVGIRVSYYLSQRGGGEDPLYIAENLLRLP
ncbi:MULTISPECIES: hypothetical protein [unclassified Pseudomonas]|uniref:hypothetical protein n=1 Tax=unclassified Pseudomonas TaxID=196821 RepID=UPI0039E008BB